MGCWPPAALLVLASSGGLAATAALEEPVHGRPPREFIDAALHWVATGIEVTGVGLIVVSAAVATALFLRQGLGAGEWSGAYRHYRANLGRGILLGLELLVAADIIGTVAVTPSFQNLAVLGLIVLIRTFLSFSLEVEIDGHWPWRRAELEAGNGARAGGPERL